MSKGNNFHIATFFEEWSSYLDKRALSPEEVILTGDLNFHLDDSTNVDSQKFLETLEVHGLSMEGRRPRTYFKQYLRSPAERTAHIVGGTLPPSL